MQAIILVDDLTAAAGRMTDLGFRVDEGGRHPGRGTANLIIPFGRQYLELLAVVDRAEAAASPQGRPVLAALERRGPGLARWSVEAGDIEDAGRRVGLPVEARSRNRPDGVTVRWRSVAVDLTWAEPWRPAFMAWDDPATHPAILRGAHPNQASGMEIRVVVPSRDALGEWLGGHDLTGVILTEGATPGPAELIVHSPAGPLRLGASV